MSKDEDEDDCFVPLDSVKLFYDMHGCTFNSLNTAYLLPCDADEIKVWNPMQSDGCMTEEGP
jgi:hypothetical protein